MWQKDSSTEPHRYRFYFLSGFQIVVECEREEINRLVSFRTGLSPHVFSLMWTSSNSANIIVNSFMHLDEISKSFEFDFPQNTVVGSWRNLDNFAICHIFRHSLTARLTYKELYINHENECEEMHGFLTPFEVTDGKLWWKVGLSICKSQVFCECFSHRNPIIETILLASDSSSCHLLIKNVHSDDPKICAETSIVSLDSYTGQ